MVKKKLYILLACLSLSGYVWLGWNFIEGPAHTAAPSICLFKEVTGLPCPSCGTTRSLLLLVQGDFRGSLMMNPFGVLLAVALIVVPLWITADTLTSSESFYRRYVFLEQIFMNNKLLAVCAAVIVALNWAWNITKGL